MGGVVLSLKVAGPVGNGSTVCHVPRSLVNIRILKPITMLTVARLSQGFSFSCSTTICRHMACLLIRIVLTFRGVSYHLMLLFMKVIYLHKSFLSLHMAMLLVGYWHNII